MNFPDGRLLRKAVGKSAFVGARSYRERASPTLYNQARIESHSDLAKQYT
ncbi:MAG TPA: hypothetical protein VKZ53_19865 [Candidatus Angelobacter sp.]|nr:hypothetical protein [Candidatus Angelobacter sp.]